MVTSEFFEQGDRERAELKLTPAVSNRAFSVLGAMQLDPPDVTKDYPRSLCSPYLTAIAKTSCRPYSWTG